MIQRVLVLLQNTRSLLLYIGCGVVVAVKFVAVLFAHLQKLDVNIETQTLKRLLVGR